MEEKHYDEVEPATQNATPIILAPDNLTSKTESHFENTTQNEAPQNKIANQNESTMQNDDLPQNANTTQNANTSKNISSATTVASTTPPAKELANMHVVHVGKILSNVSIVATALTLLLTLLPFIHVGYILLIVFVCGAIVLFTLGLVFLEENNIVSKLWGTISNTDVLTEIAMTGIPICFGVAMGTAVVSLILLLCGKEKCSWRIALNIVGIVVPLICFVIMMLGIIGGAK